MYVCICPSGGSGGVRIEIARVRKALSRAFYNCCYYHLIKILRTLFLRLFDTHARTHALTHAHANTYIHILYMNERARARVCACVVKPFGSREEERAGKRRRARSYTYICVYIMYNNIRENLTANPTALDVIEYRGGPASDLTHALIYTHIYKLYYIIYIEFNLFHTCINNKTCIDLIRSEKFVVRLKLYANYLVTYSILIPNTYSKSELRAGLRNIEPKTMMSSAHSCLFFF